METPGFSETYLHTLHY